MYAAPPRPRDPNYFMDYPLPPPLMDYHHQPLPPPLPQFAMAEAIGMKSGAEVAPNCPRCASSNTKFCYYNNYSFSQPRYFCKSCRRYWTKGGSLRSVPVGGGCRKSRRSRAARHSPYQRPGSVSSDSDQTSASDPEPSGIDLAAVFANYLNPTGSAQAETEAGVGSEPVFEELGEACALTDQPGFSDQQLGYDQNVEFPGHDSASYGLETMLNEELGQEILWPDEMNLAGLEWQPMVDLVEECGSFSSDDISAGLIGDHCGLFDLSGCLEF